MRIDNSYHILETYNEKDLEWIKEAHFLTVWESFGIEKQYLDKKTIKQNIDDQLSNLDKFDNGKVFIVKDDNGNLLGFILLQIVTNNFTNETVCFILEIFVEPKFRRQGIGAILMGIAEKFAKDNKLKKVVLNVASHNDIAHGLYKKLGYSDEKIRMSKEMY